MRPDQSLDRDLPVQVDQKFVHFSLILDIDALFDEGWPDNLIDVGYSGVNALAAPTRLVPVTELVCLVLSCRSTLKGEKRNKKSRRQTERERCSLMEQRNGAIPSYQPGRLLMLDFLLNRRSASHVSCGSPY